MESKLTPKELAFRAALHTPRFSAWARQVRAQWELDNIEWQWGKPGDWRSERPPPGAEIPNHRERYRRKVKPSGRKQENQGRKRQVQTILGSTGDVPER